MAARHEPKQQAVRSGAWLSMILIFFFQAEDGIRDLTVTGVQTCALPIWSPYSPLLPALYSKTIPCGVRRAGGPASTSQESKYPGRGESTLTNRPLESASGVQSTRSSEVAMRMSGTLKYIQYFPRSAVATTRFPATWPRMAPDLDSRSRYFPPPARANAGPCLVQWTKSRDVAIASRGISRFHWV